MNLILLAYVFMGFQSGTGARSSNNERGLYDDGVSMDANELSRGSVDAGNRQLFGTSDVDYTGIDLVRRRLQDVLALIQKNYEASKIEERSNGDRIYIIKNPEVLEAFKNQHNEKSYPNLKFNLDQYYVDILRRNSKDNKLKEDRFSAEQYQNDEFIDYTERYNKGAGKDINFQDEKYTIDFVTERYKNKMKKDVGKREKKVKNKRWSEERKVKPKHDDWADVRDSFELKKMPKFEPHPYQNRQQTVKKNRPENRFEKIVQPKAREYKKDWSSNKNDWGKRSKKYARNREGLFGRTPIPYVGKKGIYEDN